MSTARQAEEGLSLEVQRRQLEGYALQHGLTIGCVFVEEGVSGVVIAAKLDRAFRSALDALQVVRDFTVRRIGLHLLDVGGDVANGHGKLFLTIVAAFAEAERDRIRERVADVKRDQRGRGRFLGGKRPFGWRIRASGELVVDEREQAALARARTMRAAGMPLRRIAHELVAGGVVVSFPTLHRALRGEEPR